MVSYLDHDFRRLKLTIQAESITEGTLKQWNKQVGDHVEQDEEIATIETDKVSYYSSSERTQRGLQLIS